MPRPKAKSILKVEAETMNYPFGSMTLQFLIARLTMVAKDEFNLDLKFKGEFK